MKAKLNLNLEIELCDRNRNFGEIIQSIYDVIAQRDGIESFKIIKEDIQSAGVGK